MQTIGLSEATARPWDVIAVGSSVSAMFFVHGLPADLDVLVIEKGGLRSHAEDVERGWPERDSFTHRNSSGEAKDWVAFTVFGGNSNYWWANTPRLHPDDFRLAEKFGVGRDWPFGYDTLEPYWLRAETLMEVAGGGSEHVLPRSAPFPYPPHALSRGDIALRAASDLWFPVATAISNGGRRPTCCTNGVCGICPIDAKFTVPNSLDLLAHPRAHYLLDTEVRALSIEGGRARRALVRDREGGEAEIAGAVFALGANGIYNAAILLRSGLGSDALGRYLHEQPHFAVTVDTATIRNYYGGTSETAHGYHFYHDIDRSAAAAVLIETHNAPPVIREEPGKWTNRLNFQLIAEDLPQPQNRVILEDDEPVLEWTGYHPYALRGLDRALEGLPGLIPDEIEGLHRTPLLPSEAHIQGTHRIGDPGDDGVVDALLRVHAAPNVYALGSGAFPTCSPANPTLTIAALSLRSAETVS